MKLHIAILTLLLIVFSINYITAEENKSLERLGNEAAALADSLYSQDKFLDAAGKYEEAYNLFQRAEKEDEIPLGEKITQMLGNMVTAYFRAEDFENTVRIIKKRLELEPRNETYARQVSQIYERQLNKPDKAAEVLIEFDKVHQSFAVRRIIARIKNDVGNQKAALEWNQKAFELRQDPDVLQNIAQLHYRLGNINDAIKAYEDFIATNPQESVLINIYRNMGKFYEDAGNESKSIEFYEKTNRLRFNRDITLLLMTKYFDQGDYLNARSQANRLIQDNPENSHAIYYTGLILFEQGRVSEARQQFSKITGDRRYGAAARQYVESIDSM